MQCRAHLISWLWLLTPLAVAGLPMRSLAQITPDKTLGNNSSVTSVTGDLTNITGGLQRNSSLFHSFEQFNVGTNQRVYFANPAAIRNIFSRVTGGSLSNIDGLLGVAGNANLFLLNPNGIIFGPNARLDVSGSFLATTANALEFPDNQRFEATGARAVPLVEVNIPIGLQLGANPPAMIVTQSNLTAGKDLTLAAGNLDLRGQLQAGGNLTLQAQDTVRIRDTVAAPFVARSGGDMLIQGDRSVDILTLNHPTITPFVSGGNLSLVSNGIISGDAHFTSGGNFSIQNLSGNPGTFISLYDPIIRSTGDVTFGEYSGASLKVVAAGSIRATGNISITQPDLGIPLGSDPEAAILRDGRSLILRAGTPVAANFNLPSTQPTIPTNFVPQPITVPGSIMVTGTIATTELTSGTPDDVILVATGPIAIGGNNLQNSILARSVTIDTPSTVQMAGGINARLDAPGTAGNVRIGTTTPPSSVSVGIISARNSSTGNGGNIIINTTGAFTTTGAFGLDNSGYQVPNPVLNSALIVSLASEASNGRSGDIRITAGGAITLSAGISSASNFNEKGGAIQLEGSSINTSRGVITSRNDNAGLIGGVGGDVSLTATTGDILANNIIASSNNSTPLNGDGDINLTATLGSISLDQARLSTSNVGTHFAGDIRIRAANQINVTGDSIVGSDGYFGTITLTGTAPNSQITIQDSQITAAIPAITAVAMAALSDSQININSPQVTIANSEVSTEVFAPDSQTRQANSGNISIQGDAIQIISGSRFETITNARVIGNSGNITIGNLTNTSTVNLADSNFFTNANGEGNSGNVRVSANQITTANGLIQTRTVSANTNGVAGNVEVRANATSGQAIRLNNTGIDAAAFGTGGQTGSVTVSALNRGDVSLIGNSSIFTDTFGNKPTGDLTVSGGNILINQYQLNANVRASGVTGGNVFIDGTSVTLQNSSTISTETSGGTSGDITIKATSGNLNFAGGAVRTTVNADATGSGGDITIASEGGQINFNNGFQVNAATNTTHPLAALEQGGDISITSSGGQITVGGGTAIDTRTTGNQAGGNIEILSGGGELSILNSTVNASTSGSNKGGDVSLISGSGNLAFVGDGILNNGFGEIRTSVDPGATGSGGDITTASDGGQVNFNNAFQVNAATKTLAASGRGGNISITSNGGQIAVGGGTAIDASTTGTQTGGNISIAAKSGNITLNQGNILTTVGSTATGNGGDVNLQGSAIAIQNASKIDASTTGAGASGDVKVTASSGLDLTNSQVSTSATALGVKAGNITLNGQGSVTLQNSEVIASSAQGLAGSIKIGATNLDLKRSNLRAEIGQSTTGQAGNIELSVDVRITLEDESLISTLGLNGANGGDISILKVRFLSAKPPTGLNGSDIVGRADPNSSGQTGIGGKVTLPPSALVQGFRFRKAVAGNRTNDIDTNGQLDNFSTDADEGTRGLSAPLIVFTDVSQITSSACEAVGAKTTIADTELRIVGRGGVPLSPTVAFPAQATASDWVALELSPQVPINVTLADGSTIALLPGELYQMPATCIKNWKEEQRSPL